MKEPPASPRTDNPSEKTAEVTPGMAALLRGGNGHAKPQTSAEEDPVRKQAAGRRKKLVQASLVLADLSLLALVARLAFASHGRFGFLEVSLCVVALAIGAWLSCLALWLK